jgi:DNA-binding NarL/FixJ family response regulator
MFKKLNILILESSKVAARRLLEILMGYEEINEILYAPSFDKPIDLLLSQRVDIVLCNIHLTQENIAKLSSLQQKVIPFCLVVCSSLRQQVNLVANSNLVVDHYLDLEKESGKLIDIIAEYARTLLVTQNKIMSYR